MKRVVVVISILLLLIAVPVGVFYMRQQQDIRSRAAPATTLSFSPSTASKKQGDTFSLDVVVNTGSNTISAADLAINTDATKVKITGMTVGSFLTTTLVAETHTDSRAAVTLGSPPASPKQGTGTLATVTFVVVGANGSAQITFNGSQVAGIGEQGNVLSGTTAATITMSAGSGASTPTPTPIPTQGGGTPTPTPGTGGAQITVTPTPTPTPATGTGQLSITNPSEGEEFDTTTPTFTGTALAGSAVTITIYSDPITAVVTTDSSGQWTYTPSVALPDGQHQISVMTVASDGTTATTTKTFYVITSAVPVTGVMDSLFLSAGIGGLLLLLGLLL